MNANEILFRPSSLSEIMSGVKKGWDVEKSLTCKRKLISIYREIKYGRYYSKGNKYTEKGTKMEEDGITLYSLFKKEFYKKNEERITNAYFTGEPDIRMPKRIIDIKCPYSLDTMPDKLVDDVPVDYEYQGLAYCDLDDADTYTIAYTLVNAPANIINQEKKSLYFRSGEPRVGSTEYTKYREACAKIERNLIFDFDKFCNDNPQFEFSFSEWEWDIPMADRVVEFTFKRDDEKIKAMKARIDECRTWMQNNLFNTETP